MKFTLIAVLLQVVPGPPAEPGKPQVAVLEVKGTIVAPGFDDKKACQDAAAGILAMSNVGGFNTLWGCSANSSTATLQVVPPSKPKMPAPRPPALFPPKEAERGSSS
jgi:hypothetical protein